MPITTKHVVLAISCVMLAIEMAWLYANHTPILEWISAHPFSLLLVFTKTIFKRIIALKLLIVLKSLLVLLWHLMKLLLLKLLKIVSVRYGFYYSHRRWRSIRALRVVSGRFMFRARRRLRTFWLSLNRVERWIIAVANLPLLLLLVLFSFSFDLTRKTMVKKGEEMVISTAAVGAGKKSSGIRAWVDNLDKRIVQKVKTLSAGKPKANDIEDDI